MRVRLLPVFFAGPALLAGCQHAQNYLDPRGPAYAGNLAPGPPTAPGAGKLRIVTFNVEYALHVDRAIAALQSHERLRGADVLCLQEMDAPGTERIAQALGLNWVYYPAARHPGTGRDVGDAVLSRWPIESSFKLPLPHKSRGLGQARAAVSALLHVRGLPLRVYCLHLGSPLGASPGQRRDQIDVVMCDAKGRPEPVIVAGDFNSSSIGERLVKGGYVWLTRGIGPTAHGLSFDHVFARGGAFSDWAAGVAREVKDASDHRPVWVEVTVLGGAGARDRLLGFRCRASPRACESPPA